MTGAFAGRDGHEVDALVTDRYLEALLAAHARGADRGPTPSAPADPIRATADRLARDLPRFHPSFLFEEALAGRLAETAARMARSGRTAGTARSSCRCRATTALPPATSRSRPMPQATVHGRPPVAHRRRADLGRPVAGRRRLRRLAPYPPGRRPDGPRRSRRRPVEARLMPIKLPSFRARRDVYPADLWTKCPSCETMIFNKQLDKALRVCPTCGHHFRLSASARLEPAARPRDVGRARRRPAVGRSSRLRRPEAVPGSAGRGADRDRDARRGRLGDRRDGWPPRRDLRHGLRVHGRLDGRGRRREGHPRRRARARGARPADRGQRVGRGADAGGHARADAAGQDAGCHRAAAGRRRPVPVGAVRPDDRRRVRVVRGRGRRQRRRTERADRVRRLAGLGRDHRPGAARGLPALGVPVRPRVHRPHRRPARAA